MKEFVLSVLFNADNSDMKLIHLVYEMTINNRNVPFYGKEEKIEVQKFLNNLSKIILIICSTSGKIALSLAWSDAVSQKNYVLIRRALLGNFKGDRHWRIQ